MAGRRLEGLFRRDSCQMILRRALVSAFLPTESPGAQMTPKSLIVRPSRAQIAGPMIMIATLPLTSALLKSIWRKSSDVPGRHQVTNALPGVRRPTRTGRLPFGSRRRRLRGRRNSTADTGAIRALNGPVAALSFASQSSLFAIVPSYS